MYMLRDIYYKKNQTVVNFMVQPNYRNNKKYASLDH